MARGNGLPANRHRGEVAARLGGRNRRLVLTLGALAELEAAYGAEDMAALTERFAEARLSARDVIRILGAGLRGAGEEITDEEVARLDHADGVAGLALLSAELLRATFAGSGDDAAGGEAPPDP